MEQVQSADGTTIAFDRVGKGPPVVLVVGAFCDRSSTSSLASHLCGDVTVYAYDRRGRGDSGDAAAYSVEREVEDLAAVLTAAGGSACVFGHSSGGALALEAAARGVTGRRLAVYEPPYTGDGAPSPDVADQLRTLVASGCRSEAAERFLALTGASPGVVAQVRASPDWPAMEAIAHTLPYDVTLVNGGAVPVDRLARIAVPTLALTGGASYDWAVRGARAVAEAVPDGECRVLEGQHHAPADDVLAPELLRFFGA